MKNMNSFILISLLFLWACGQENIEKGKTYQLESIDQIALEIDETTPNFSMGLQYFAKGDQEWIFNINWNTNALQIYNLSEGTLMQTIPFEKEGDQGVGDLMAFHVHHLDSIFLFPFGGSYFTLTDSAGKLKNRVRYSAPENHTEGFVHNISFISPPVIQGKNIILKTRPAIVRNYREMTNELLAASHLSIQVDMETGRSTLLPQQYPTDYLAKGVKRFDYSSTNTEEKVVYSFFGDHHLYWAADYESPLTKTEAKSQYLNDQLALFPIDGGFLESQKYSNASSRYENLLYDPFREVFYRFAYPDLEVFTEEEVRALRNNPGPFVIMVFDKDLKLLTETYFEGGKYLPMNAFVGKKGLYLSINNPDNPAIQEDLMRFEVFELNMEPR
jgi:hypothetical protein